MRHLFLLVLLFGVSALGQNPQRFTGEVDAISKKYDTLWDASRETLVFTGSSSIRIWEDLEQRFPDHQIVNSGFGGSQASDLSVYLEDLVLRFNPRKVFIYEGDNDLSAQKKTKEIMGTLEEIIGRVHQKNPDTKVVLISAKPSIARWNLKRRYKRLNRRFEKLSKKNPLIDFADVWSPMLDRRKVKRDIFIEDGLHMNGKGYEIWYDVIKEFME